jgi:hypothetical protein
VFEEYVTELAVESGLPVLCEVEYKAIAGGDASAVEALIVGDHCNIFIEAKMSLFADDLLLHDSPVVAYQKTKRVGDAIVQGWKVGEHIGTCDEFEERFRKPFDFLLVVTSRELFIGGAKC